MTDTETEAPKPSEVVDDKITREEERKVLLAGLPSLRPAYRFTPPQKNRFRRLLVNAAKDGIDINQDDDYAQIRTAEQMMAFSDAVYEWVESIADDPADFVAWSEGKDADAILAIYSMYEEQLGE